jgi:hypothetical protein
MKMTVFSDNAIYSLVMMEEVCASETSLNFYETAAAISQKAFVFINSDYFLKQHLTERSL